MTPDRPDQTRPERQRPSNSRDLREVVLDAAANGLLSEGSALRLIFVIEKAGEYGHIWWKRTTLAKHWGVHKTTITRDYEQWTVLGFVKTRPNPFKGSAKLVILPWSKVWDDAVWTDPKKVASMLPEVRQSYGKKGRIHATRIDRTDATHSTASPINENSSKGKKQQQPAAGPDADSRVRGANPKSRRQSGNSTADSAFDNHTAAPALDDGPLVEGASEAEALLAHYTVKSTSAQIRELIGAGQAQGLKIDGILAFLQFKLKEKRDQNDAVYSIQLLIKAIADRCDLRRWAGSGRCPSRYFEEATPPVAETRFSTEGIRAHLATCACRVRGIGGFDVIAEGLERMASDGGIGTEPEQLEQHLAELEREMLAVAVSRQTEDDRRLLRAEVDAQLKPYRKKLSSDQLLSLERQYLEQRLIDRVGLPRLSLFYAGDQLERAA